MVDFMWLETHLKSKFESTYNYYLNNNNINCKDINW